MPCKQTIGAIYGVRPSYFDIFQSDKIIPADINGVLALKAGNEYQLKLTEIGEKIIENDLKNGKRVKIKRIAESFEGIASIKDLSTAFYDNVWSDPDSDFRELFSSNTSKERAIQNQAMWLEEVWGGRELYSAKYGNNALFKRMISKHPQWMMSLSNALCWIRNMNRAMDAVITDDALKCSLKLYWGHFFAFFEFSPIERSTFLQELQRSTHSKL